MARYGMPYQGNKSKIAEDIIFALPSGKRLVDLFGGGGAITHCACIKGTHKWEKFLYNDINPLLPPLLDKAIKGYYNENNFKPKFVTRDEFFEKNTTDGYIRYIWSFGNGGDWYLFGKDIEEYKHALHNAIVFEDYTLADKLKIDMSCIKNLKTRQERRIAWRQHFLDNENNYKIGSHWFNNGKNIEQDQINQQLSQIEQLTRLRQLERLQQLERVQQLERLQIICMSYENYQYQDGDIVYCDIPYEQDKKGTCNDYDKYNVFDNRMFYKWAKTVPFAVYFSSYEISDNDFECVWEKEVTSFMAGENGCRRTERLYVNKYGIINKQLSFF